LIRMSANNLLPLLNQLQLMESTLTNFMLETILKLQSLTDVKVFLLIETSQKRRYCGSKDMTDAFESRGLMCSSDTDIAITLDPTASALIESAPSSANLYVTSSNDLALSPDNRSRGLSGVGPTNAKRRRVSRSSTNPDISPVIMDNDVECKAERADKAEEIPVYEVCDDEDDDFASVPFTMDDSNSINSPCDAVIPSQGREVRYDNKASYPFIDPSSFFNLLEASDLEIQKYNTLMSMENRQALYQKGTLESKVLKSVCYSVGKNASLKFPYPLTAENKSALMNHWSHHCDLFVGQCANAGLLVEKTAENSGLLDLIPKNSAVGYIRQRIRDGFRFKRLAKLS